MTDNLAHDAVTIERTLHAPAHLVWQMWTVPHHFASWYGPDGATMPVAELDVRVGGTRLVCMEITTPGDPMLMWFTGQYLEVVEYERLVYTESMSNQNGDIIDPAEMGMPSGSPITTEVRVELEQFGETTKMVVTHVGIPAGSPGATGWAMALDKLAAQIGPSR